MVTELRIYFEGDQRLRPGFHEFFREIRDIATSKRCKFRLIDTGGTPVQDYRDGLAANPDAYSVLVLDSDEPIDGALADLCDRRGLNQAHEQSVFWMVQVMESWFLADVDALREFYDGGFNENALPRNPHVEQIPKLDVLSGLKRATKNTKAGEYHKTRHAVKLLERITPSLVRGAAPNCERLFRLVVDKLSER